MFRTRKQRELLFNYVLLGFPVAVCVWIAWGLLCAALGGAALAAFMWLVFRAIAWMHAGADE